MVAGVGAGAGGGWLRLCLGFGGESSVEVGHWWSVGGGRDGWMDGPGGGSSMGLLLFWEVHRFSMDGHALLNVGVQGWIGDKYDGEISVRHRGSFEKAAQIHFRQK